MVKNGGFLVIPGQVQNQAKKKAQSIATLGLKLVAGTGFEPVTFIL
jgi:hypothetical protein